MTLRGGGAGASKAMGPPSGTVDAANVASGGNAKEFGLPIAARAQETLPLTSSPSKGKLHSTLDRRDRSLG